MCSSDLLMLLAGYGDLAHRLQFETADEPAGQPAEEAGTFPRNTLDWSLLIIAGFIFSTLFGIIAQTNSAPGSSFGLYDVSTGIVLVMIDILLVVFTVFAGETVTFATALLIMFLMYATGLVMYPHAATGSGLVAGALIRGGFDCSNILLWTIIARKSFERPQRTFYYFGIFRGISTVYIGRALGSVLLAQNAPETIMSSIPTIGLWVIAVFAIIAFYLTSQGNVSPSSAEAFKRVLTSVGEEPTPPVDEFHARIDAFATRLALSEREKDVLTETLHGQSRAGVAKKLYLSPDTVKYHLSRIYLKAGVNSRQELVALVEKEKLD